MKSLFTVLLAVSVGVAGCSQLPLYGEGQKEAAGTVIGAGTGALIGSQIGHGKANLAAVAIGTLAGALIGQQVGQTLDRADKQAMQQNAQTALETARTNQTSEWVNPDTGHSGSITPTHTYENEQGQPCREYTQTVMIGGEPQEAHGTACRQADGTWLITK